MINVLVTGGYGQLAKCIRDLEPLNPKLNIVFKGSQELDITKEEQIITFFETNTIDYCINCAAYTAVDRAESDYENAKKINTVGSKNLAIECSKYNVSLIHISTDFVFDGNKSIAYNETDQTNASGIYSLTKLKGEQEIARHLSEHFIIRTSWLYSEHGNNFMKTMISLSQERDSLNVVDDQIGTPTYARDLASTILKIVTSNINAYGVYHFSNEGVSSWYDFAVAIFDLKGIKIKVNPITTKNFPTPAKRPNFSVLDKTKIKALLNIEIPHWRESLKIAIAALDNFF